MSMSRTSPTLRCTATVLVDGTLFAPLCRTRRPMTSKSSEASVSRMYAAASDLGHLGPWKPKNQAKSGEVRRTRATSEAKPTKSAKRFRRNRRPRARSGPAKRIQRDWAATSAKSAETEIRRETKGHPRLLLARPLGTDPLTFAVHGMHGSPLVYIYIYYE